MQYWIFLSTDGLICFTCRSAGHLAKHCPKSIEKNDQQSRRILEIPANTNLNYSEEFSEEEMCTSSDLPCINTSVNLEINTNDYAKTGFPILTASNSALKKHPHSLSSTSASTSNDFNANNSDTDSSYASLSQIYDEQNNQISSLTEKTEVFKLPKSSLKKKMKVLTKLQISPVHYLT